MGRQHIIETDLKRAEHWSDSVFIEDDIVLTERLADAPIPSEPKRMNFLLLALCRKGKAQYAIDNKEVMIRPNDIILISDRHIIDNYMASPDLEAQCIMLSKDFYYEFMQNVADVSALMMFAMANPAVTLTEREAETFSHYFHLIKSKLQETDHLYRKKLVCTLLLAMFYDLSNVIYRSQQSGDKDQSRAQLQFARFIRLVEKHFREERRVSWYAQQLCITSKYLSEVVKQTSKRTPLEWINSYVTLELRVLLKNSNMSIKEIAEELHFPNQSFLGKFFKEHVGMSPSEYRKG